MVSGNWVMVQILVNGITVGQNRDNTTPGTGSVNAIVPPGATYKAELWAGAASLSSWAELR